METCYLGRWSVMRDVVWQFAAFPANAVVFILVGSHEAHQPFLVFSGAAGVVVRLTPLGRSVAVDRLCLALPPTGYPVCSPCRRVLFWVSLWGRARLGSRRRELPERQGIIVPWVSTATGSGL